MGNLQHDRGDVIVEAGSGKKRLQAALQKIQGCGGRLGPALFPGRLHLRVRKVDACVASGLVQTVGGEQSPVSRRELDDVLVVSRIQEQARWQSSFAERFASVFRDQNR